VERYDAAAMRFSASERELGEQVSPGHAVFDMDVEVAEFPGRLRGRAGTQQ
jgi:hypothetical protein